jgi:hypothetical protein
MASRSVFLTAALLAAAGPAASGIVFREVEITDVAAGAPEREVRRVFAADGNLKSLVEESADPLTPAGSYLLAAGGEALLVDPGRATIAPVVAADMQPVAAGPAPSRQFSAVVIERLSEEAGPPMFGLPTRHFVYLLSYQEDEPEGEPQGAARSEERHEFWAAGLPGEETSLAAWRDLRVAEDAGIGAARRDIREAMASMYEHGLFLRHVIERLERSGAAEQAVRGERTVREVTALNREPVPAELFARPTGYALTEFLAPGPDEARDTRGE